jgi:hypothetical protein
VGKVVNHKAEPYLQALERNPVVPAVRGPDSALEAALAARRRDKERASHEIAESGRLLPDVSDFVRGSSVRR